MIMVTEKNEVTQKKTLYNVANQCFFSNNGLPLAVVMEILGWQEKSIPHS